MPTKKRGRPRLFNFDMTMVSASVPTVVADRLSCAAIKAGVSTADIVRMLICHVQGADVVAELNMLLKDVRLSEAIFQELIEDERRRAQEAIGCAKEVIDICREVMAENEKLVNALGAALLLLAISCKKEVLH